MPHIIELFFSKRSKDTMSDEKDILRFPLLEEGETAGDDLSSLTGADAKNRKLTLSDAVTELERHGFSCDFSNSNDEMVVGTLSISAWWNPVCIKRHVFVHRVVSPEFLTVEKIEMDLCKTSLLAEEQWGNGFMVLVYLVDEEDKDNEEESPQQRKLRQRRPQLRTELDQNVVSFVNAKPENELWRLLTILAVQDGHGNSFFYEGDEIDPELKYWAGLLTGRSVASLPPYHFQKRKFAFVFSFYAFAIPYLWHEADRLFVLLPLWSITVLMIAILAWRARCRRRRRRAEIFSRNSCEGGLARV